MQCVCVSFGRRSFAEYTDLSVFAVRKVHLTPAAWAILLTSWLKPSINGMLALTIFSAFSSSFGSLAIGVRAKEHRDAVSTGDHKKSALAEHVLSYEKPHEINWRSLNIVDKATNMKEQKVREAFHIQKRNLDWTETKAWKKASHGMPFLTLRRTKNSTSHTLLKKFRQTFQLRHH